MLPPSSGCRGRRSAARPAPPILRGPNECGAASHGRRVPEAHTPGLGTRCRHGVYNRQQCPTGRAGKYLGGVEGTVPETAAFPSVETETRGSPRERVPWHAANHRSGGRGCGKNLRNLRTTTVGLPWARGFPVGRWVGGFRNWARASWRMEYQSSGVSAVSSPSRPSRRRVSRCSGRQAVRHRRSRGRMASARVLGIPRVLEFRTQAQPRMRLHLLHPEQHR